MFKKIIFLGLVVGVLPNVAIGGNTVKCDSGYYLPANSEKKDDCTKCPSHSGLGQLYCPGGKNFQKKFPFSQGIEYCKGKLKSNAECDTNYTKTLDAGNYFPVKSDTPTKCSGTNLTEAKQKITKELDDMKAKLKAALSVSSNASSLDYYLGLVAISQADVGKLYCPGGAVGYDWKYPLGIKVCNKKYVTGENNQTCTDTQPNNTASSSDQDAIHCDSGYFLPKGATKGNGYTYSNAQKQNVCTAKCNGKYDRTDGYICTGGWYKVSQTEDMGLKKCANTQIVNERMTSCLDCVSGTRKNFAECTPLSDDSDQITKLVSGSKSCNPGFYLMTKQDYIDRLKDNSSQSSLGNQTTKLEDVPYCMSCFDWGHNSSYGYRCPGVKNKTLTDKEQGKEYCSNGQVTLREDPATCVDKPVASVTCEQGQYLKANEQKCTSCKSLGDHIYCKGGTYKPSKKDDQGYESCPDTYKADPDHTKCVCPSGKVEENSKCVVPQACVAGNVWSNGKCVACNSNTEWKEYLSENRMYCPEVINADASVYQQFTKCPKGAWPNYDFSDCDCMWGTKDGDKCKNITISANDLQYGPKGKSAPLFKQCWTKSTSATYKKCMGFDD